MTSVHRIETVLSEDGKLSLDHLPFRAGQAVEVIVLPLSQLASASYSLQSICRAQKRRSGELTVASLASSVYNSGAWLWFDKEGSSIARWPDKGKYSGQW
jgi:hypothetical protein